MTIIKVMDDMPILSNILADWCVRAVYYIIGIDKNIDQLEQNMIRDLAKSLGVDCPSGEPQVPEIPPSMSIDEQQYLLRMLFLAAWVDGEYKKEEKSALKKCIEIMEVEHSLQELAHTEVKKAIFIASVTPALPQILSSSIIASEIQNKLHLTLKEVDEAISKWLIKS
ncbi:MAG: hypothetical protein GY861_25355 [bacterium]|nr:hypothetical protein [bacterium]